MNIFGCKNLSSNLVLEIKNAIFLVMVLLYHICRLHHKLDSFFFHSVLFSTIKFWCLFKGFRYDSFVMFFNDFWYVVQPAVADFKCVAVKNCVNSMTSGKIFVINWRNIFETFVETDLLKRGLNHIMVRFCIFGFSDYCWCILN